MKKRKKKKLSYKRLKNKVWNLFSEYIRKKECLEITGALVEGICVTCGKRFSYKKLQAGHFIPGRHLSILYDERGCHIQCKRCNIFLHGNLIEYFIFMEQKYGRDVIDDLRVKDKESKKYTRQELEQFCQDLEKKIRQIESKVDGDNIKSSV